MTAGGAAALIAAGFFAIGVIAGLIVLARLSKLISAAAVIVSGYSDAAEELMREARAVVERADQRLAKTDAPTASVDEAAASVSDLAEQVSAVAGTARLISAGLGTPVLRIAALGHGIRYALRRRAAAAPAHVVRGGAASAARAISDGVGWDRESARRAGPGREGARERPHPAAAIAVKAVEAGKPRRRRS